MASRLAIALEVSVLVTAVSCLCGTNVQAQGESLHLRVHESGRYLVDGNGGPFFWLGDTGWGLFTALTEEEAAEYLDDRRDKGFTVVQAVLAWGSPDPNPYGEEPWLDGDPARPNPAYFDRVARIVDMAAERGIVMALLPAWGDFVTVNERINAGNAYEYGNWLGARLGDRPNIVWVLGGDRLPDGHEDVFRRLAAGIADAEEQEHLMTYHPRGGGHSSSEFFHEDQWLDVNMIQSGHSIDYPDYRYVLRDYRLTPVKPTVVGEPRYENIIHGLRREGPRIDDHDVRKAAWHAVLSGACGHTYGCNGVFQFWRQGQDSRWDPRIEWRQALDLPGARHMGQLKAILTSLDWHRLQPAPEMISGGGEDGYYVAAARAAEGDFALVYFPESIAATVDLRVIRGEGVRASWLNPRSGSRQEIGEFDQHAPETFLPPTGDEDPDWVLLLESARPDTTPPRIASVYAGGDPEVVRLRFSEPVDPATAESTESYAVQPGVMVEAVELSEGGTVVTLRTSPMQQQEYTLTVAGVTDTWITPNAVPEGTQVTFTWTEQPPRVTEDLLALYTFHDVADGVVHDASGSDSPLPLRIDEDSAADVAEGELVVSQDSLIASERAAEELGAACMQSNEITMEAWVQPASLDQEGPARIVTLSRDPGQRNFTLGQQGDRYIVRLRTTETGANGVPSLDAPEGSLTTELAHVVYTRAADGTARIYIDGNLAVEGRVGGDLSNWDESFRLGLANELTRDRTWSGSIRLVALYSRALSAEEVLTNFQAGPDAGP
ncbi:MAG: DUF4038 domain-containing protein [Armatimonadota bacterium]